MAGEVSLAQIEEKIAELESLKMQLLAEMLGEPATDPCPGPNSKTVKDLELCVKEIEWWKAVLKKPKR